MVNNMRAWSAPPHNLQPVRANRHWFQAAVLLSLATAIVLSRLLGNGHDWGDDFGLYLQYAQNIVHRISPNTLNSGVRVPIGFPLILALLSPLHNFDYLNMKAVEAAALGILGVSSFVLATRYVSSVIALLVSAASTWNGYIFIVAHSIISRHSLAQPRRLVRSSHTHALSNRRRITRAHRALALFSCRF